MKLFSSILFVVILFTGCEGNNPPKYSSPDPEIVTYSVNSKYDVMEFTPVGNTNYFCLMLDKNGTAGVRCYPKQSNQLIKEIK